MRQNIWDTRRPCSLAALWQHTIVLLGQSDQSQTSTHWWQNKRTTKFAYHRRTV